MKTNRFPKGWDEQRVQRLIAELDSRTDAEWVAADEEALAERDEQTTVSVPKSLLPEIRRVLATTGLST